MRLMGSFGRRSEGKNKYLWKLPRFSQKQIFLFALALVGLFMPWLIVMNTYQLHELVRYSNPSTSSNVAKLTIEDTPQVMKQNVEVTADHSLEAYEEQWSLSSEFQNLEIWKQPNSEKYQNCLNRTQKETGRNFATDGYLLAHANGGLNQMKLGISDMVAIAKTMNATLIVPSLDHNSYWNDPSEFQDIFDLKTFIDVLKDDITILESVPSEFASVTPLEKNPVSWSKLSYYRSDMKKLLKKHKVVKFLHSDSRLANNVAGSMQRLRCHTMYEALRFRKEIEELGKQLINRLKNNTREPYVALHLRYEKDMLAFTGCSHSLSKSEDEELTNMRHSVQHWKEKNIDGFQQRLRGHCPMTPREVALFLEAIGYPSETKIYVVGGEIFGEEGTRPLREKFPNLYSKTSLTTEEELRPFVKFQNQLAAIDYVVSLYSDVFTYSFDGNMARALQGHRKFKGYRKTISPDRKNIVKLIDKLDKGLITEENFSSRLKSLHENRAGEPSIRHVPQKPHNAKREENFYANPFPGCICEKQSV